MLTLLQTALNPDLGGNTAEQIRDKLLVWEESMTRYERAQPAGDSSLSDNIRIATLLRALPEAPRFAVLQYLGTQPANISWLQVRQYLLTYLASASGWRGSDDMDVGALDVAGFTSKGGKKGKARAARAALMRPQNL
jgi:hypothetical protein